MDAVWRLLQTTTSTTSTSQSQESEEIKNHHADTARNEETEEEEQEQQISSKVQEQQEQQQLQQLQQLERFLQEVTEEDLLRFRNQELQHIEEETLALLELQKMLHTLVQEQGEDLQVVEENVGDAEQDTKEAVFTLAKASRINAASYRLKSILWGAGLGSGLGAVAGGALGLVGTPVAALILGAGGAATLGLAGGGLGHSVGSFIEKQINREVDKELITHHHRKVWVDDELCRNCMECGAEFTLFLRRHHCRICGGIFCASCCQHERELKYPGVEQPILQRICKHCAEHSPHSQPNSSTSSSSSSSS